MSRRSTPRSWGEQPAAGGMFGSLLDEVLGSGVKRVVETVVQKTTVPCNFCGTRTVFRCASCGKFVCNIHCFVNAQAWNEVTVICSECISQSFDFVHVAQAQQQFYDQDWPYRQRPWDILGVPRYANELEINSAFKEKAKMVHPDIGGNHKEMSILGSARMWMLEQLRNQR